MTASNEYFKKYYEENKERLKEYQRNYKKQNPDSVKKTRKAYYENNKEIYSEKMKDYYDDNKERITQYKKEWYDNNKENVYEYQKQYRNENKDFIKQRHLKRLNDDPLYALKLSIRKNIIKSFRRNGFDKNNKTEIIIGCTFVELKNYLESKFDSWMTWENRGKYKRGEFNIGWDIDHVIPLSTSNTIEDIIKLNHYTNLQPLCSHINRDIKSDNIW